jgi:phosphoribosyl-dephospho-CoA transferase
MPIMKTEFEKQLLQNGYQPVTEIIKEPNVTEKETHTVLERDGQEYIATFSADTARIEQRYLPDSQIMCRAFVYHKL